ncbi:MAG: VWA domain-containing protein [Polyangiaceae bacterium]|nr:VWA domain-containing protein [Polyangiaceae bacterium]
MAFSFWFRSPALRRGVAIAAVVLAAGGLILHKSSAAGSSWITRTTTSPSIASGTNAVSFSGSGARGTVSLSHSHVLRGSQTHLFAEVRIVADPAEGNAKERAPISLAVVLDTSGSMEGEKINEAKRSVLELLAQMRDDDEIALVRYSDSSELLQPLARVGSVRSPLASRIRELFAGGGTNIPRGLSEGLTALRASNGDRVRRVVLVSDGLDSTRAQAEQLAEGAYRSGVVVSSLGIGLDFDEAYMGSVAQSGHGNFAFVKDGASLASFLSRELVETASTTIENAVVTLTLPEGVTFVSATGADASPQGRGKRTVELSFGSLFAGDDRRGIVELATDGDVDGHLDIIPHARWNRVSRKGAIDVDVPRLTLVASRDPNEVMRGRDGAVLASAASVMASKRQIEAASAYAQGDVTRATELVEANEAALSEARAAAPAQAVPALESQIDSYRKAKETFRAVAPSAAAGRAAAKASTAREMGNVKRKAY